MKSYFLKTFMACCMMAGTASAQNLAINGDFSANGAPFCDNAPIAWNASIGNPGGVELTDAYNSGNWWIDMTDCANWGNYRIITQTIPTIPGTRYGVGFDLGSFNDPAYIAAGITASAGGTTMTFISDDFSGSPLAWHRYGFCFDAYSTQTTISFMANPQLSSSSPGWAVANNPNPPYNHDASVVGIDNIVVVPKGYDLIANGAFEQNGYMPGSTVNHTEPKSWKASTMYHSTGDIQLSDQWQPNNFWVDLTDDKDDNKRWVEQSVPSADNMMYRIHFSIGAGDKDDVGVDLYVNGGYRGTFTHKTNGSSLSWRHFWVDVLASGGFTSLRFEANTPSGKADVVGLDNVSMVMKCCNAKMIEGWGEVGDEEPCDCPPSDDKGKKYSSTSVKNVSNAGLVNIYPNPAQDVLNISLANVKGGSAAYKIYDIAGKELMNGTGKLGASQQLSVPVQHLPAGTYIIELNGDFPTMKQKFAKE